MVPGPGRVVPSTALISPAESMPWAIRSPKIDAFAASALRCSGLVSVLTAAYIRMSASVIVLPRLAVWPTAKSSKKIIRPIPQTRWGLLGRSRATYQPWPRTGRRPASVPRQPLRQPDEHRHRVGQRPQADALVRLVRNRHGSRPQDHRSEEHTSELQSRQYLACRL